MPPVAAFHLKKVRPGFVDSLSVYNEDDIHIAAEAGLDLKTIEAYGTRFSIAEKASLWEAGIKGPLAKKFHEDATVDDILLFRAEKITPAYVNPFYGLNREFRYGSSIDGEDILNFRRIGASYSEVREHARQLDIKKRLELAN